MVIVRPLLPWFSLPVPISPSTVRRAASTDLRLLSHYRRLAPADSLSSAVATCSFLHGSYRGFFASDKIHFQR